MLLATHVLTASPNFRRAKHGQKAPFKVPKVSNINFWIGTLPKINPIMKPDPSVRVSSWYFNNVGHINQVCWKWVAESETIKIRIVDSSVSSTARTSVIIRRWRWRRRPMAPSREMTLSPADATVGTETDTHVQQQHNTGIHWDKQARKVHHS